MGASSSKKTHVWNRVMGEIHRESRKAVLLGLLLLVLCVIAGRELFVRLRPSEAEAASPQGASSRMPGDGRTNAGGLAADDGNDLVELGNVAVDRDLFTPNPVYFPPRQTSGSTPVVTMIGDGGKQDDARRAVQAQAQALTLQSTMLGDVPTAIVNGRVLRADDWISGFQVIEIQARSCTLGKLGVRVVLELPQ